MDILLLTGLLLSIFSVRTSACNCSSSCLPSPDNKNYRCNPFTEECLYGCKYGFSGADCSIVCPGNCKEPATLGDTTCNETTIECLHGCKDGFFGSTCSEKCSSVKFRCTSCHVGNDSALHCTACILNFYLANDVCRDCPYWCADAGSQICDPQTGQCIYGCKSGRYGRYCDKYCSSTCYRGVCDNLTGTCIKGCDSPVYCGQTCQNFCNERCSVSTWGQHCDQMCSPNCRKPANDSAHICDSTNGSCLYGCISDTQWGSDCTNLCSCHCKGATCQQDTGICTDGCEPGWYGDKCSFNVQTLKQLA